MVVNINKLIEITNIINNYDYGDFEYLGVNFIYRRNNTIYNNPMLSFNISYKHLNYYSQIELLKDKYDVDEMYSILNHAILKALDRILNKAKQIKQNNKETRSLIREILEDLEVI